MAAPILWAPGKIAFFLQGNRHAHKIPRFRGGRYFVFFLGGGIADFIFMGARIFLRNPKFLFVFFPFSKDFGGLAEIRSSCLLVAFLPWGEGNPRKAKHFI